MQKRVETQLSQENNQRKDAKEILITMKQKLHNYQLPKKQIFKF